MTRLALLAGVLAANVAAWSAVWWMASNPADTSAAQARASAAGEAGLLGDLPDKRHVYDRRLLRPVESVSRPLFARSREAWRPPAAPQQPAPAEQQVAERKVQEAPPPRVKLVGVSMAGDQKARALLRQEAEVTPVWVLEGDDLGGWTVSKIDAQSVDLRNGERVISIALYPELPAGQ